MRMSPFCFVFDDMSTRDMDEEVHRRNPAAERRKKMRVQTVVFVFIHATLLALLLRRRRRRCLKQEKGDGDMEVFLNPRYRKELRRVNERVAYAYALCRWTC